VCDDVAPGEGVEGEDVRPIRGATGVLSTWLASKHFEKGKSSQPPNMFLPLEAGVARAA
jgi:hypothetical protein